MWWLELRDGDGTVILGKEQSACLSRNQRVEVFEGQRQMSGQSGGGSECSASLSSVFSAGWAAS